MTEEDFKRRAEEFFVGLQDLVKRTGIALATSESLGADGEMAMVDATNPRGHFLRDPKEPELIAWHRPGDYVDHAAMPEQKATKGALDTRASLTIGPVTFFEDGEIRVREGTAPTEIATLVLAAVKDSQAKAIARYLIDRRAPDSGDAFARSAADCQCEVP